MQDSSSWNSYVSVKSSISGVRIYFDSIFVGITPQDSIRMSSGSHLVRFVQPNDRDWFLQAIVETVQLKPQEHILINVNFPDLCRIATSPFNADFTIGDSVCGTTPIVIPISSERLNVSIFKKGFAKINENLDGHIWQYHFNLMPSDKEAQNEEPIFLKSFNKKGEIPIYISAGGAVLAGAVAAYFKIKADNRYSDYQRTGDSVTLERVKSFDKAAGVSLFVAEMSLILFSYLLISR
jgi:hypothetical protein